MLNQCKTHLSFWALTRSTVDEKILKLNHEYKSVQSLTYVVDSTRKIFLLHKGGPSNLTIVPYLRCDVTAQTLYANNKKSIHIS